MLRLGHVLLTVADTQRTHDFYTGVLSFRLSAWVYVNDDIHLGFLRCNARHHSLAFGPCAPGKAPHLQHIMLQNLSPTPISTTSVQQWSALRDGLHGQGVEFWIVVHLRERLHCR